MLNGGETRSKRAISKIGLIIVRKMNREMVGEGTLGRVGLSGEGTSEPRPDQVGWGLQTSGKRVDCP